MTDRELLGITDAAAVLGVHPNTLRKWADDGIVPHVRLPSGYRRFRRADLERYLKSLEAGPDGENRNDGPQSKP